jgi:formylglycine-generating enzyme required for sulfatase activity
MKPIYPFKTFILLAFMLLFAFQAVADEFEVKSFEKDENDLAARRYERMDINGEPCALVKIKTDLDGLGFESGVGIVGDVEYKEGQYWVYLVSGERRLSIYKTRFVRLDYSIPLTVKSYDVFHMVLTAKGQKIESLPVTFQITPKDAQMTVDGQTVSNLEPVKLAIGEHTIKARRENYRPLEETITINENNVFFTFTMQEIQDAGVQITSEPAGAEVILDGVALGKTPVSTFYPAGRYPIKLQKKGYVTIEDVYLEVAAPQTSKNYTLEENVGYLTVKTRPEATVRFNGKKVETNKRIKLNPSVVNVKVTMPKAVTLEESVVIKRNDDKTIELMPDIQTGTIQVAPTPFDAKVELTGDAGEHYTAEGMKVFSDIPVGTYELKVSKDCHQTYESEITLRANDKVTRNPKLKKGPDIKKIAGMELVKVEGGCFDMGCTIEQSNCDDDEKPVHEVCVDDFYISKTEVTQKMWRKVMGNNHSRFDNCDNCPVENVSWKDVQEFIRKLNHKTNGNYRLPTEAEWEYAARGGKKSQDYKYAGSNDIGSVAWHFNNSGGKTHPVGQKQPNELGLYDMSGNVWEWCSDRYDSDYYKNSPRNNPQGPNSGSARVYRGGCWRYGARYCRVAFRDRVSPGLTRSNLGFRLSRDE